MTTLETQYETLSERVDNLIRSHRCVEPLLATTTRYETIRELIGRTEGLEQAVREIAREVEELAAEFGSRGLTDCAPSAASVSERIAHQAACSVLVMGP